MELEIKFVYLQTETLFSYESKRNFSEQHRGISIA